MAQSNQQVKRGFIVKAKHEFDHNSVYYKKNSKWLVKKAGAKVELELIRNRTQIAKGLHDGETLITIPSDSLSGTFVLSNPQFDKPKLALKVENVVTRKTITHIDTLPELIRCFSENLHAHAFRTGSDRVAQKPATIISLVENLNKAEKLSKHPKHPIYIYSIGKLETQPG